MRQTIDTGKRYRKAYRGGNLYITVSDNNGNNCPYSIMLSASNEKINQDPDLQAIIDGAEKFVNVSLRGLGWGETLRKCISVSRGWYTLYGLIFLAIAEYLEGE